MRAGAGLRHLLMQKLFSALATKTSSQKLIFSVPHQVQVYINLGHHYMAQIITYTNTIGMYRY